MIRQFCGECGNRLKALHWPEDDSRCPNKDCKNYDKELPKDNV